MTNNEPTNWEEVKSNFFRLTKVGDECEGVLVDRKIVDNNLKAGSKQAIYELIQSDGNPIFIGGRGGEPSVIGGLEQAALGEKVKLVYAEERPSKKAGFNATKVLKVFRTADRKLHTDVLEKYRNKGADSGFVLPENFDVK